MYDVPTRQRRGWPRLGLLGAAGLLAVATAFLFSLKRAPSDVPPPASAPQATEDIAQRVDVFCGHCHATPPPDTFPRSAWKNQVERGYVFFEQSGLSLPAPPVESVVRFYEDRAPLELPFPTLDYARKPLAVHFERSTPPGPPLPSPPAVSNVNIVHLFGNRRPDLLACDMRHGLVMALRPYDPEPSWQVLGKVSHPAHAEVVDLDGDGIPDILVANLGSFPPTDDRCGSVVWLRGGADGRFTPYTLLEGVGRVADVQAARFRGPDKPLDLVVGVFGWQTQGEIVYLENQTSDWSRPRFVPRVLDARHGTIHVPVADLNGDGRPDFVALISQEHETIVAFLNEGDGRFRKQTLYTAPHPGYGSSGIQLVDLDGDGDLDVLYSNGDVLDEPYLFKPYHSIQWLENVGNMQFVHHPLAPMYGVHRAIAADLDGDGDMDILAVSFLPVEGFPGRKERNADAVIVLEQTSRGQFVRHALEKVSCDHVTCAAGDLYGSGRMDLVIGNFRTHQPVPPVTIWKNLGRK